MEVVLKLKNSAIICLALLVSLPLLASCESAAKTISTPGTQRAAVPSEWPKGNQQYIYEVLLDGFLIKFPETPKRISVVEDSIIVFNTSGSVFHISTVTASDFATNAFPKGITTNSKISVSAAGQIPFEKTVSDPTPKDSAALAVWNDAMRSRKQIFGDSNPVFKSEKNNLKAYYYESPVPPLGCYATIHDLSRPDLYLHIAAQNITFESFRKVIGSSGLRD